MGGYGSGRPATQKVVEDCRSLNVSLFHKGGCLRNGWQGNWTWSRNGQEIARIGSRTENGHIVLDYNVRQNCGDWEPITQTVPITHAACHYGGQRPYFLCSGVVNGQHCGRRVGKLYAGGKYFLCRHCYRLSHASQSEPRYDRMLRRANKLRTALGGEAGTANWIAPKPKGMWQRTYQRKRFEINWCEDQANRHFIATYAHLLSKNEQEMFFD